MATPVRYNNATFLADSGAELALTWTGPFTISTGLKPNINRFVVPFHEYDKLGGRPIVRGRLRFWHLKAPRGKAAQSPDVEYRDMKIVSVEPGAMGVPVGQKVARVVEYTLGIADVRERVVPPRGGRVNLGLVEPGLPQLEPATSGGAAVPPPPPAKNVRELMRECLNKTGLRYEVIDFANAMLAAGVPPNLQWFNAYAPVELQKLLDHCSAVACPQTNGSVLVRNIGHGEAVRIPKGGLLATASVPEADRRGKIVIFTSAPNPVIETTEVRGPNPNTWEFVIQDTKGRWRQIDDSELRQNPESLIQSGGPETTVKGHYVVTNQKYRDHVARQLYHCIRLSKEYSKGRKRLLRRVVAYDLNEQTPKMKLREIEVSATRARFDLNSRLWSNSKEPVACTATQLDANNNVIFIYDLLGKVEIDGKQDVSTGDVESNFKALSDGDLRVLLSVESAVELKDEPGKWVPEYFNIGFRRGPSSLLSELDESSLSAELQSPGEDTVVISKPELRLLRSFGLPDSQADHDNEKELRTKALNLALRYLTENRPAEVIRLRGFVKVELSGTVAEVQFDPGSGGDGGEGPTTTIKRFSHWTPLGPEALLKLGRPAGPGGAGGTAEAYPEQAQTLGESLNVGGAGTPQPLVPLQPPPPVPPAAGLMFVVLQKNSGDQGTKTKTATYLYDVYAVEGGPKIAEAQDPQWGRAAGKVTLGTIGIARVDKGGVRLLVANEHYTTGACP